MGCRLWGRTGSDTTEATAAAAAAVVYKDLLKLLWNPKCTQQGHRMMVGFEKSVALHTSSKELEDRT